jgi:hypothetical protein
MIRTSSTPKAPLPPPPLLPEPNSLSINPEAPTPGIITRPSLLRPKPRKPPQSPSASQLQVPSSGARQRPGNNNPSRPRRRAHSRVSDSGWLTDEIIGGKVDEFDFEGNLGKFDKRRDWEEFRVTPRAKGSMLT